MDSRQACREGSAQGSGYWEDLGNIYRAVSVFSLLDVLILSNISAARLGSYCLAFCLVGESDRCGSSLCPLLVDTDGETVTDASQSGLRLER
jgi:hypothetical protein